MFPFSSFLRELVKLFVDYQYVMVNCSVFSQFLAAAGVNSYAIAR